jgi:hypothetical protein
VTFLADESVDRQIVECLRLDGHQVAYVAEMSPGMMDEVVLMESRISANSSSGSGSVECHATNPFVESGTSYEGSSGLRNGPVKRRSMKLAKA